VRIGNDAEDRPGHGDSLGLSSREPCGIRAIATVRSVAKGSDRRITSNTPKLSPRHGYLVGTMGRTSAEGCSAS